jgi:glyoxylase-like metal-dependent hydrolase (beta-lactamase superfamily II)
MPNKKTKVYFLNLGKMEVDMNVLIANYVLGLKSNPTPQVVWDWFPITAVLIDHNDGKILYDLGCHPDGMSYWPNSVKELTPYYHSAEQTLEHQLAICNTKPDEIKTIILSHMHIDHAGCLYMFPHTDVIVHEAEFAAAFAYAFEKLNQEGRTLYIRDELVAPIDQYTLIKEDTEVCEGVKILHLPGHTIGMCGLQVELENLGTMIFTRDLCYTALNYGPPIRPSGIIDNLEVYNRSIAKVRKLQKNTGGFVVFGHDQKQFLSMKHAPEYYD